MNVDFLKVFLIYIFFEIRLFFLFYILEIDRNKFFLIRSWLIKEYLNFFNLWLRFYGDYMGKVLVYSGCLVNCG